MKATDHTVRHSLFVVLSVLALVSAALVLEDGGFAIAIGLIAIAILAPLVPFVVIVHEEREIRPSAHAR